MGSSDRFGLRQSAHERTQRSAHPHLVLLVPDWPSSLVEQPHHADDISGDCAIRIWASDDSDPERFEDVVLAGFAPLQVSGMGMFGFVVLDVPATADLQQVRRLLRDGERAGRWTVDELCVTTAWRKAAP